MKITLTVFPRKHAKKAGTKLSALPGVKLKRVRDDGGRLVTVRTLDVGSKSFGRAFGMVFKTNVSNALATKKANSASKRRAARKA